MAVSDDEIIKRRLLIEGEGGNDDKRLNNLLKSLTRWCNTPDDEDSNLTYQRILCMLAQCEFTMEKSLYVHQMNLQEQHHYDALSKEIEQRIAEATDKIASCKAELQQAKTIRKNRQEYDVLAKTIQQHPDRQATLKELQALDKELSSLAATKQGLEEKLELRRKQFLVLVKAIHELQSILDEDEKKEEEMEHSGIPSTSTQ